MYDFIHRAQEFFEVYGFWFHDAGFVAVSIPMLLGHI